MSDIDKLVQACQNGELDSVKALVEGHNKDTLGEMVSKEGNNSDGYPRTPLQSAAENEQFEIVEYLVKTCSNKVDIIGQTLSNGWSSLHFAAWKSKKNVQTLQCLIVNYNGNIKTIINQKNDDGYTPLDCAYTWNDSPIKKDIVALLRQNGGKADRYDKNGSFKGKGKGELSVEAEKLIQDYKNQFPKGTPLVCACEKGRLDDVRLLVDGHDVEKWLSEEGKNSSGGLTRPIDAAATFIDTSDEKKMEINKKKMEIIIYLANKGAKGVKLYGKPILTACVENNLDAVKAMIKAHDVVNTIIKVHDMDKKGMSVEDMLKYIWKKEETGAQWTLLQCAVRDEHLEIIKYLVNTYPKVDLIGQTDSDGWNSLHVAAHNSTKDIDTLRFLIENYKKDIKEIINQVTVEGKTPLDLVLFNNVLFQNDSTKEFVNLLRENGAKAKQYIKQLLSGKDKGTALVKLCIYDEFIDVKILVEDGVEDEKCGAGDWFEKEGKYDDKSYIPLEAAIANKSVDIVKYLIEHFNEKDELKKFINRLNTDKKTPLDIAYQLNESDIKNDIVTLLRKYGGKANWYDNDGSFKGKGKGYLNDLYENVTIKF